ncbi:unnamed protein product [Somion occarium]|uniref:lytic cellulose monooxygenase (C4-dehydrogenating) n=1 Tax=Somion occarium TaxID=3059160 RepID=A0ABP1D6H4_9APHY
MKSFATLLIFVTAALPFVSAHGFVSQVAIDGTLYKGNHPNKGEQFPSPVRLINDPAPVKHADNPNLSCGQNAKNAKVVADANPGSLLTFSWQSGDDSVPLWPHNTGPMITYMAECTGTTCDKFDSTQAKWFKIHEVGKKTDGKTWVQADIQSGKSLTVPLPDDIKAGDYLVRHEIVALHLATDIGGAEFYPSCTQVRVGGNGTGVPDKTVSFPGAYKDDSAGIFDPTVFNPGAVYTFPGPPVAKLVATGAAVNSTNNAAQGSSSPSTAASSQSCKTIVDENGNKRSYSRVMRSLMH